MGQAGAGDWSVKTRKAVKTEDGEKVVESVDTWKPRETAVIICDMWNNHHCTAAARRVVELAPYLNQVVQAARKRGVLIIHAPSGCANYYQDTPARKRMQQAPFVKSDVSFGYHFYDPKLEGPLADHLEKAGCSCDTPKICGPDVRVWTHQNEAIEIKDEDAVGDKGQEIFNLLEQRKIENVILMGVHANRCIVARPFGVRAMVKLKKNVVVCRDLTDSYHRDPGKHFAGLAKIIRHIETWWCPTITSESITGKKPFKFAKE
ncbi:MAG: hypothetical protein CMO80_16750 [Verrucomicrobiales bacterium]|nr:hypothetical protein [Verrucomicrobiales bacterium]